MKHRALLLAAFLAATPAFAQDWPGFRGAARDGKLKDFKAPASWPQELQKGWSVEVGTGYTSPALVEGRLYVHARQGDDEVLRCLDAATGKEVWKQSLPTPYEPDPTAKDFGKGPFATPTVADGRVFTFGISGTLACRDARTGELLWKNDFQKEFTKTYPEWGTGLSPLVHDGLCIVHAGDATPDDSAPGKGAVFAFTAAKGELKWRWDGDGPGYASPIAATLGGKPQVILQTKILAVGLSPADGKELWKTDFKTVYRQNSVTPVVAGNLLILSGTARGTTALALDGPEPKQAWQNDEVSMYMSSPVLKGNHLFGFTEKGRGQFFCLEASSGTTSWTGPGRQGDHASLLEGGDVILALLTSSPKDAKKPSQLVVFEASEKGYSEKARYKVADGPAWAHPVVSGKSIFIKDQKTLTRWSLP